MSQNHQNRRNTHFQLGVKYWLHPGFADFPSLNGLPLFFFYTSTRSSKDRIWWNRGGRLLRSLGHSGGLLPLQQTQKSLGNKQLEVLKGKMVWKIVVQKGDLVGNSGWKFKSLRKISWNWVGFRLVSGQYDWQRVMGGFVRMWYTDILVRSCKWWT